MTPNPVCRRCGIALAESTTHGYCPSCLLRDGLAEQSDQRPEVRGLRSEVRDQKTEDGGPKSEDRGQRAEAPSSLATGHWSLVTELGDFELLEVIAIIALLAALSRAKQKAHAAVCLSNQRQINLSVRLGLDEEGGHFGGLGNTGLPGLRDWYWQEFGHKERGWICPSAPVIKDRGFPQYGSDSYLGTVNSAWRDFPLHPFDDANICEFRAGSYAVNWWVLHADLLDGTGCVPWAYEGPEFFTTESQVVQPMATPVLADSVWPFLMPNARDTPGRDLAEPGVVDTLSAFYVGGGMSSMAIPRHGSRPNPVPRQWPADLPLPGAINVAFFDGHGELVKLDRLWQLYWYVDYQPPAKRPGLP